MQGPAQQQQQGWPSAQSWPSGNRPPSQNNQGGQGWVSNTVQMVRRWSGRTPAMPPVDQNPLVLYRPSTPLPPPIPKSRRWKRSRTVRIAFMMKHRRTRWQHARPKGGRIASIIVVVVLVLLVLSTFSGSAYAYKYYQDQLPRLQSLANQQISQTTHIYDRNGLLLYDAYNQNQGGGRRTAVEYQYIPQVMQDAQTAAEDPTFWQNSGIDPVGIVRAASQYASAGAVQSGGSTITQQLIKNMTGETAVSLNRKIPEAALAIGLTQQYTKAKILEMYFNVSPYGAQNLGVEAAAEDYFHLTSQCDKNFNCTPGIYYLNCDSAHEQQCNPTHCDTSKYCDPIVGLARASLLAGMPQDPPTYDPTFGYIDQATGQKYYLERQQYVLEQMLKYPTSLPYLGTITPDMVSKAEALTAKLQFPKYTHPYYHGCQHFVNWVITQIESEIGVDAFLNGGFNIRTSIDANVEAYVERTVKRHLQQSEYQLFPYPPRYGILSSSQYNLYDAAVVVMNAKTGEVLAMDGSADYNATDRRIDGNFNSAVQAARQPGSTIKPIIYATAFEHGWYPGMVIPDYKTYFPVNGEAPAVCNAGAYCPVDYGGTYSNTNTTVRSATADSRNIPAIKASLFAGVGNVIQLAQRMGITTLDPKKDDNVSFALGTSGIPLIQMVGVYQVFANQGTRVPPRSILDIWDNYGHNLYHFDPKHPGGVQVITPQIAFLMTSVLSDEYARQAEFWPDHDLSFWGNTNTPNPGYPNVAAKTGTTDAFKDNWTMGYTSNVVVGVWAGNADDEPMQNVVGITGAAPIWHSVMTYMSGMCNSANDGISCGHMDLTFPAPTFVAPSGVTQQCVSSSNGLAGSGNCDYMLTNEYPGSSGISGTSIPTK